MARYTTYTCMAGEEEIHVEVDHSEDSVAIEFSSAESCYIGPDELDDLIETLEVVRRIVRKVKK